MDAGVHQRLHEEEYIRRSGARERRRHVDPRLLLDLDLLAERAEDGLRAVALLAIHCGRRGPRRDPHPDLRRGIGHGPHDLGVIEAIAQHRERRAGDDRDHELLRGQLAVQLAQHRR